MVKVDKMVMSLANQAIRRVNVTRMKMEINLTSHLIKTLVQAGPLTTADLVMLQKGLEILKSQQRRLTITDQWTPVPQMSIPLQMEVTMATIQGVTNQLEENKEKPPPKVRRQIQSQIQSLYSQAEILAMRDLMENGTSRSLKNAMILQRLVTKLLNNLHPTKEKTQTGEEAPQETNSQEPTKLWDRPMHPPIPDEMGMQDYLDKDSMTVKMSTEPPTPPETTGETYARKGPKATREENLRRPIKDNPQA